ncbi:BON domain-containing protein [Neorhizobium lilium]|uniref:BON domain-containing protein n=1 Tax=Neorhizobium lilium TaxID=2503024 RepID=A0A444LH31_9HYPH|nr:BON domain-containing protein [Neorhizobium lilium]RWX78328.1 BON domain-containing protein [Neorhizobium lilium]
MTAKKSVDDITREEDYRDYDTRNIDQGWPYADKPGAASDAVENAAYGDPEANFDRERNGGFLIDSAGADGLEEPLVDSEAPGTVGLEVSDDLEERITDALDELDVIEMNSIDVHVDQGNVTIEGTVDEADTARKIIRAIQGIAGVRKVTNNLQLVGVDSRIPDDD